MEVNYFFVIITTGLAFLVIVFLTWKKRKGLRSYEKRQIKTSVNPEEQSNEE